MRIRSLIAAMLFAAASGWAAAQENAPCKADTEKFCKDVKLDGIRTCLKGHEADLSDACRTGLAGPKEPAPSTMDACKADLDKFCNGAKEGSGGNAQCLKDHEKELSPACTAEIAAAKDLAAKNNPCSADLEKFCKGVKPGAARLTNCLEDTGDKVSETCKAFVVKLRVESRKKNPCTYDLDKFCADVRPGEGRLAKCLKDNEAKLSELCKADRTAKAKQLEEKMKAIADRDAQAAAAPAEPAKKAEMTISFAEVPPAPGAAADPAAVPVNNAEKK